MKFLLLTSFLFLLSCSTQKVADREPANFQTCFESLNAIIRNAKPSSVNVKKKFSEAKTIEELEALYADRSFIDMQREATQEEILKYNSRFIELLDQPLTRTPDYKKASYVTLDEANIIFKDIEKAPVNVNNACYDPKGTVGFCFGRATMVHMEALIRNVDPDSVRKIWVAGDMSEWGHHVASLVKAQDGWYIIDIEVGKVVKVKEWFKFFKKYQPENAKEMMLFISRAERFGPYDLTGYSNKDLFNTASNEFNRDSDFYRGFFHDYFEDLDKRQKTIKKFPSR